MCWQVTGVKMAAEVASLVCIRTYDILSGRVLIANTGRQRRQT